MKLIFCKYNLIYNSVGYDCIDKNKLTSLSDSHNYRAIALNSLFGKVMDACIINIQCHVFKFHDLLFAYKANHSTVQCVSTIKEIISYYNLNRSPVLLLCVCWMRPRHLTR